MSDHTDDNHPHNDPEEPQVENEASSDGGSAVPPNNPTEALRAFKDKASEAFKSGSKDARESFEQSFPKAKEEFSKGINDASYAIGYAVSFGTTLIKEFTPETINEGFERGRQAGTRAADEVIQHRRANHTGDTPEEPDPAGT